MIRYPPSGASLMAATTPPESGAPVQFRPLSRPIWYSGALGGRCITTPNSLGFCGMDWPDYLRDQAANYRKLAEQADDPVVKNELLELASVCEEVANNIEDHLTGG